MMTYPVYWHPVVEVTQLARHGIEHRETRKLMLGTHCGTHIDSPRHFIPNGTTIDKIDPALFVGPTRLLHFTPSGPKQAFDVADFERALGDECPQRLVLRFDWSDHWGEMAFYTDNPFITEQAAQWLIDRGVRLLGMDSPQVDSPDHGSNCSKDSPVHKIMLGQGAVFVECMTNLKQISQPHFDLAALPLKIKDGDGAPCRCVAIEREVDK